jgi:hypothetical protein
MSPTARGMEWHAGLLRGWHLAILRFAVTLDNADRLALLRIAHEIDRLESRHDRGADFEFFRRTSAELCAAIEQPNERAVAVLRQYLARIEDERLGRVLAAALGVGEAIVSPARRLAGRDAGLWKGLASRSNH